MVRLRDRRLDEGRRPKDLAVNLDAWKPRTQFVEGSFHSPGHRQGIGPGKFFDDEHEAGSVIDDGIADGKWRIPNHLATSPTRSPLRVARLKRQTGEVLR